MSRATQARYSRKTPRQSRLPGAGLRMIGKGPGDVKRELFRLRQVSNTCFTDQFAADWLISTRPDSLLNGTVSLYSIAANSRVGVTRTAT